MWIAFPSREKGSGKRGRSAESRFTDAVPARRYALLKDDTVTCPYGDTQIYAPPGRPRSLARFRPRRERAWRSPIWSYA